MGRAIFIHKGTVKVRIDDFIAIIEPFGLLSVMIPKYAFRFRGRAGTGQVAKWKILLADI